MSSRSASPPPPPSPAVARSRAAPPPLTPRPLAWGARVSPAFRDRVRAMAGDLGADPDWLMAAMAFETAETFAPDIRNPASGATGLIQFMPATARSLGTDVEALAALTAEAQLDWVARYLAPYRGRLAGLADLYMAILWPRAVGAPDGHVLFAAPSTAYRWNRGLDVNGDGEICKAEAALKVHERLIRGLARTLRA